MAVNPISLTRVSHNLQTITLLEALRSNTLNLFIEQNRLASGNKISAPSEDPVTAFRAMQTSEVLQSQDQLLRNISHADSILSATDTAIGEVNDQLTEAHNIALTMVNSTASSEERQSEAQLILGIIDQLVSVGNRKYREIHLFGGQRTQQTPFTQDYGVVEYRGDTGNLTAHVDVNQDPAINLTGDRLFGALSNRVQGWVDLNPALQDDTRLADMGGAAGQGIQLGLVRVTLTSPAVSFTADLSQADTAGDVIDMLNGAAAQAGLTSGPGAEFNATYNAASNGYEISAGAGTVTIDGNVIEITDLNALSVSDGIQLVTNDAVVAITGNDITNSSGMGNGILLDNNGVLQATISGNTILTDGWANYGVFGLNNGSSMTVEMTGNNVVSVQAYGVEFDSYGASMDLTISGNTIETGADQGLDGLVIYNDGGQASVVNALISGNTVTVNRGWTTGIVLDNDSGAMNATLTGNTLNVSGDEAAGIELYNFGVMNVQLTANTLNLNVEHSKGVNTFNYGEADFTVTDNTVNVDPNTSAFQSAWGFAFRNLFADQVLTATGNQINGEAAMGMYLWNPDNPLPQGTFTVRASGPVLSALNNGMLVWCTPNVAAFTFVP